MTPEKHVQNAIMKYLSELSKNEPVFYERRQAGGFSYKMGIPDLYAVYNGTHIEIEVKRPGGSLSIMQEKFRDMCKKNNICWLCAESLNDVKEFISQNKQKFMNNIIIA